MRRRVQKGAIVLTLTGLLLGSPAQALMATQGPQKAYAAESQEAKTDKTKPYIGKVTPFSPINRRQPTLYAQVWDKESGLDLEKTHVVVDGKKLSGKVSEKGTFKQRIPQHLDIGWHTAAIKAWDKAGNYSQTDWSFEVRGHKVNSAKYQASRHGNQPKVIVLHSTAGSYPGDYNTLMGGGKVSSHFYVRKSGYIVRMVPDNNAAWHAGRSSFKGISNGGSLNSESLGIEIESKNRGSGDYTKAQIEAVAEIVNTWQEKYNISDEYVTGHAGITGRKSDPKGFPWEDFWGSVHSIK